MGFGAYDEEEHERRESINSVTCDAESDELYRHDGRVTFEYESESDGEEQDESDVVDQMLENLNKE